MDKRVFLRAARKALYEWGREEGYEDLVNSLWLWYLESPGTQEKLAGLAFDEAVVTVKNRALQVLSEERYSDNTSLSLYSSDSVKDALKGRSENKYLVDVLPTALERLANRNPGHAEAIRRRYVDGLIPQGAEADLLTKAHRSLAREVNVLYLTTGSPDGPGSRHEVYPETRKAKGCTGDPTGNIAVTLIENPEIRDEYYEETDFVVPVKGMDESAPNHALNIFDPEFSGLEMYRAWVMPEMYPNQPQPRLENWSKEDLEMYCGVYT